MSDQTECVLSERSKDSSWFEVLSLKPITLCGAFTWVARTDHAVGVSRVLCCVCV